MNFQSVKTLLPVLLLPWVMMMQISHATDLVQSRDITQTLHIAVASNFKSTLLSLVKSYKKNHQVKILISSASTAKLTTQIRFGAPYDIFMAADTSHPKRLIDAGIADTSTLQIYAQGKLALISRIQAAGAIPLLLSGQVNQLAIANPKTAPYGAVAMDWLLQAGFNRDSFQYLMGENISQTWQYFHQGGADAALVAIAQIKQANVKKYHYWLLPQIINRHLTQAAILLKRATNKHQAQQFLLFLKSPAAAHIIQAAGYYINTL